MNAKSSAIVAIARSIAVTAFAAITLCGAVAAYAQSMQMAASISYNGTYNPNTESYADTSVIYGVAVTPQTALPPSMVLNPLPINPANTLNYTGFTNNALVYAPSIQPHATVDLIAGSNGSIYRFFGPTFSGSLSGTPPPTNAVPIWNSCFESEVAAVRAAALVGGNNFETPSETSGCGGPENPGAMAIDGNGTLYVLSVDGGASCNESENPVVELWAFPTSTTSASGYASTPVLIDNNVAGPGTSSCIPRDYSTNNISFSSGLNLNPSPYSVADLMVVPAGAAPSVPAGVTAPLTQNDVVVMFGDFAQGAFYEGAPIAVLADYNAASLAAALKGNATLPATQPLTVLNSTDITHWAQFQVPPPPGSPSGTSPTWQNTFNDFASSVAAWPADSNILLLDENGNIFKFNWSSTTTAGHTTFAVGNQPPFWTMLPAANSDAETGTTSYQVQSLRTGVQAGNSYAFVTASTVSEGPTTPSEILSLDNSSGANAPQTVVTNDGTFSALAISNPPSGTGTGAQCVTGCNLTGGNQQQITGTPAAIAAIDALGAKGKITETVCIVQQDPRYICNKGAPKANNPWYSSKTLPVTAVCPNSHFNPSFGNTIIPDYICGDYGSGGQGTGTGFVLVQGNANGVDGVPNLLIYNDANADAFFDPGQIEACTNKGQPSTVFGWAPWSGSPTEGAIPESPFLTELTYGCGTSRATSSGMSINMLGGALNLATASEFKANNAVSFAEFKYANLFTDVLVAPIDIVQKVRLEAIIVRSELFLAQGQNACAARKIWRADQYVADHASHFHGIPGFDPNPYGRSRSRLANLFLTIFSRIEGNPAPQMWPLAQPPGVCVNNIDIDPDGY